MSRFEKYHRMRNYFRRVIELDTAHDASHLLSVLTAVYPDIDCDFGESYVEIRNITNNYGTPLKIVWRLQV